MYLKRDLESIVMAFLQKKPPQGLILAGLVGAGKTTMILHLLERLKEHFEIFSYSGDSTTFRAAVALNSEYLLMDVTSKTNRRALVFVDEVQKSEPVFDALKIAFDQGKISFIVSGSNPAYLDTVAKKRLQRRAEYLELLPFSLPEILLAKGEIAVDWLDYGLKLIVSPEEVLQHLPSVAIKPNITATIDRFCTWGGLPLVYLADHDDDRLGELRKVIERGFEPMSQDADSHADIIRIELARLHSREFAYEGFFQKTGLRRREKINQVIDELINHGYLVRKKPIIFKGDRRSYLTIYSYVDPGMITFLTSVMEVTQNSGYRLEGYIHARLTALLRRSPVKRQLGYYRPYIISEGKLKFLPGEIDFIIQTDHQRLPIEVKTSAHRANIDTALITKFVKEHNLNLGIVLYGGAPYWDAARKLLFFPYWLV